MTTNKDPWKITADDRRKHNVEFQKLNPAGGYLTGAQAKTFLLHSGLPPAVLGQIWELADIDSDGRMSEHEFSVAVHLIQLKLDKHDLPKILPSSMKVSPLQGASSATPNVGSMGGFNKPPTMSGTTPAVSATTQPTIRPTMPMSGGAPSVAPVAPGGFIKPPHPSAPPTNVPTIIPPPDKNKQIPPNVNNPGGKKDLTIPQPMKLKYTQMFNKHDKSRKGYLSGMEARAILTQSNLTHNLLAQIWSLSDLDSDGKLTTEEFTLAMHLVDLVRSGQTLPAKLPPELIPPAYRRQGGATSTQGNKGAVNKPPVMPTNVPSQPVNSITSIPSAVPQSGDSFGDLLGGLSMPTTAPPMLPEPQVEPPPQAGGASVDIDVTFEDKRRENFTKGQAELEKRRAQLREQQKKENEERLAAEAAEQEKREKLRLEQEQKKQQAFLKQQEKQRKIEQEKEEIRQKALEQRESARRELERNRQLEWERQRREQLVTERQKHQNQVEALEAQVSKYRLELETLDNKKLELSNKIAAARTGVTDITSSINSMRTLRDVKITDIDRCNKDVQDYGYKFNACQKDRLHFDAQLQSQANSQTDTFRAVKHSHNSRQDSITKLKTQITQIEDEQNTKRTISDSSKENYNKLAESLREEQEAMSRLKSDLQNKQQKWNEMSRTQVYSAKSTPATSVSEPPASESHKYMESVSDSTVRPGYQLYTALYQFEARNADELSIQPGVNVWVKDDQTGVEESWLIGALDDGTEGWFPEAYVEMVGTPAATTAQPVEAIPQTVVEPAAAVVITSPTSDSLHNGESSTSMLSTSEQSSFTAVPASGPSPIPGKSTVVEEGVTAEALYPWLAKKDNHLTFNKGDIILLKEQQDMWASGELNGKVGWFPKSYVKILGEETVKNGNTESTNGTRGSVSSATNDTDTLNEYYVASFSYSSSEPGDLSFNQGDSILVIKKDGAWWTGIIGDTTGIFPANYVTEPSAEEPTTVTSPTNNKNNELTPEPTTAKKPEIATVIAGYTSSGPEQLDLVKGQLIQIRKRSESGWWEGELQARGQKRKIGWFPANYVKVLGAGSSARSTPDVTRNKSPAVSTTPTIQESAPQAVVTQAAVPQAVTPEPASVESQPQEALEQVVAQFPYVSQMPDELSFDKGSIITVYSHNDDSWWKGELNGAQGVFPSNYVIPLSEAPAELLQSSQSCDSISSMGGGLAGADYKRQIAITELIDTEETFMADMDIVLDVFYKPLKNEKVLTEEELTRIFVNWKELMIVNTKLLQALRVRKRTVGDGQPINMIGDLLCENLPHMTPYIRFCSCQLNAAALLQHKTETSQKFKDVCQNCCRDPRTKGLPVSSFLLKPMQRITKYPLMLQKIIKYTPEDHSDYQNMQDALSKANLICEQVNEGVREKENSDKLEWIQSHIICDNLPEKVTFNSVTNCLGPRKFVYSGTLCKAKSGKELYGFLFNDFFLLTTPSRPQAGQQIFKKDSKPITFKMYRAPIFLNEVMVVKKNQEQDSDSTLLHVNHIDRVYSLKASNKPERDTWIKHLDIASKTFLESERTKREKIHSVRVSNHGCGRLMVIILEGHNLIASDENGKSDPYCEVSMGAQENKTKIVNNTLNPKWNSSMQFTIKDPKEDVLCITVFDRDLFTPNDFLGRTEIRICDIQKDNKAKKGPITKKLPLYETESGEVSVKLDLQLYEAS